jgi:hypothetical protein
MLIKVEEPTCPNCGRRITEATKRELLQAARAEATNNCTTNDLWITDTRRHEVIQAYSAQGMNNLRGGPFSLWEWLLSNGNKLRDLVLAGAGGTYVLGFIIWSIYAFVNNLGLLPALSSQYLIAGLLPITLLGLGALPLYIGIKRKVFSRLVVGVLVVISLLLIILPILLVPLRILRILNIPQAWSLVVVSIVYYLFLILMTTMVQGTPSYRALRIYRLIPYTVHLLVIYFCILGFMIFLVSQYALLIYPVIPQSWGGAKPRCAYLDVDTAKISVDSKSALFSADGDPSTITRRSDAVGVYYAGDNWVLVKKAAEKTPTYEIDRDAINAIIWC